MMNVLIRSNWLRRIGVMIFGLPGAFLFIVTGTEIIQKNTLASAMLVASGVLLVALVVFITTSQVEITSATIIRKSFFGHREFRISDIVDLSWRSARGQLMLTVRAKKGWIMLSSLSFSERDLRLIEKSIRAMQKGAAD